METDDEGESIEKKNKKEKEEKGKGNEKHD